MNTVSAGAIVWAAAGILAAAAVGVTAGITGVITRPTVIDASVASTIVLQTADASTCAGGSVVTSLPAGARVLAVGVSADGEWIGVRNPALATQTVWMRQTNVARDDDGSAELPVGGECPTMTTVQNTPDAPAAPAASVADSTAPVLGVRTASSVELDCQGLSDPGSATLSVEASDDTGVTAVDVSWSGAYTGQGSMTLTGSTWTYLFDVSTGVTRGDVTLTLTARDAAGNRSSDATVAVFVDCVV